MIGTFTNAKCKHKKGSEGPYFNAKLTSTDGRSRIEASIREFSGFKKEYEIEQGAAYPKPFVTFEEVGASSIHLYTSYYLPPYESVGFGEVVFREAGRLLGIGYGPAMYDAHAEHAVFFTGVVECEYPGKKGKKGKKPGKA